MFVTLFWVVVWRQFFFWGLRHWWRDCKPKSSAGQVSRSRTRVTRHASASWTFQPTRTVGTLHCWHQTLARRRHGRIQHSPGGAQSAENSAGCRHTLVLDQWTFSAQRVVYVIYERHCRVYKMSLTTCTATCAFIYIFSHCLSFIALNLRHVHVSLLILMLGIVNIYYYWFFLHACRHCKHWLRGLATGKQPLTTL